MLSPIAGPVRQRKLDQKKRNSRRDKCQQMFDNAHILEEQLENQDQHPDGATDNYCLNPSLPHTYQLSLLLHITAVPSPHHAPGSGYNFRCHDEQVCVLHSR